MGHVLWATVHGTAPNGQIALAGLLMAAVDPLTNVTPPSLTEMRKAVRKLNGGRAVGICNTRVDMLKTEGEP